MSNRATLFFGLAVVASVIFGTLSLSQNAFADDPEDRVVDILEANSVNGTVGVYLKEVNGSVIAGHNEGFIFEPASTIKVGYLLNAMDRVEDNEFDLMDSINYFQDYDAVNTSCPVDTNSTSDLLETGLGLMMVNSDNAWTQAIRVLLGQTAVNDMMQDIGMTDSLIQHRIGCGPDIVANPNQLTLVDAGKLYTEVATGFYDLEITEDKFYEIIDNDNPILDSIIDQEVVGLGLSSDGLTEFKSERDSALKAGSYGLSTGLYRSTAGWVELPFKNSVCDQFTKEYVYGAFINAADSLGPQDDIRTQGIELFREEIRNALESWAICETDLILDKTGPVGNVVAGTEISYTVDVDNLGPNDATNVVIIDELHPGLQYINNTGGCSELNNTLTCNIGTIIDGGSVSFDVNTSIPADYVYNGGSVVGNEAEVFLDQVDLNPDNNDDSVVNNVIAETDVAILSFNATQTPDEVMLGDSFNVTLSKNVTNFGPSSPVDIDAMVVASGDGVSIVPSPVFPGVDEVEINEEAELFEGEFMVTCEEFGVHEITFSNEIMPVDAEDPNLSNNQAEIKIEVDCVIPVQINIHPASDPNSVNIIKKNGLVPVAILSTSAGEYGLPEDVDATMVDPLSVHFGPTDVLFDNNPPGGATEIHNKGHIEDSYELDETTQDGDDDMVLHFKAKQSELDENDSEGCVKGKIDIGGMLFTFFGCDDISVPPAK